LRGEYLTKKEHITRMLIENMNDDEKFIQEIKHVKENISLDLKLFKQEMLAWNNNFSPNGLKVISKEKIRIDALSREEANQKLLAESMNRNKKDALELEQAHAHLRDLERQKVGLEEDIQNMETKINKLKNKEANKNSQIKKKLNKYRELAKVSKKLTGTKFDYQGPNVSGIIVNGEKLHVFDISSAKLSEQDISKCLWKHLKGTAGMDWSRIFQNDQMEVG